MAWACSDVTKRHYRGRCTANYKGVFKHRPRSGVGAIMSRAGAWVSRPPRQAKASQQASNPPGHRWRRAPAALNHATGQAVATGSRTRSTPQRRLIRVRVLPLPAPSRWRWPSGTRHRGGRGRAGRTRSRASGHASRHGQAGPHWWHRSGQVSTQQRAKATGPHRQGQHLQGIGPHRQAGTGRHRTRSRAGGHASRHRQAGPHWWHRSGRVSTRHLTPSTQPLALATGHRTHAKGRQATPKGSAAPPIRGQRGTIFAAISGAVRSRPLAGHRIPHQGKQQSTGGTVQACGQPHRQHRPKASKPWAGRCSLEQNTQTGHQHQRFRRARQKAAKARGKGKRKRGRIYVNE